MTKVAPNEKRRLQVKQGRMSILAELYIKGWSYRQMRTEVMRRMNLPTYSLDTLRKDLNSVLTEWREERVSNVDDAVALELRRIDDTVRELWEQWELSKEALEETATKRKGTPKGETASIETLSIEESRTRKQRLGDPRYVAEIRQQLIERRKLLGLYAPEKKEIAGEVKHRLPCEMSLEEIEAEIEALTAKEVAQS